MVAYRIDSNPIEIGDLRSKVKVTVTDNVTKNDEKKSLKFNYKYFWKYTLLLDRTFHCRHFFKILYSREPYLTQQYEAWSMWNLNYISLN